MTKSSNYFFSICFKILIKLGEKMFKISINTNKFLKYLSLANTNYLRYIQTKTVNSLLGQEVEQHDLANNEPVRVIGWVKSFRDHKKFKFLHLNDGSDHRNLQLVIEETNLKNLNTEDLFKKLHLNTSIEVEGLVVKSEHKQQNVELKVTRMKVIGECDPNDYPFKAKGNQARDITRNHIHLRSHTSEFANVMRFRSSLTFGFHEFFEKNRFTQIHTPIITASNCEGGCETFQVVTNEEKIEKNSKEDAEEAKTKMFFSNPAFLTASAQLHLETMTTTLAKVFYI